MISNCISWLKDNSTFENSSSVFVEIIYSTALTVLTTERIKNSDSVKSNDLSVTFSWEKTDVFT